MPEPTSQNKGATVYLIAASFLGAAGGGAWLGMILMSLAGLYGRLPLWQDLLAATVALAALAGLVYMCRGAAGRLAALRLLLIAVIAALNTIVLIYFTGNWVCEVPVGPQGPLFADCRLTVPPEAIGPARAALFFSPTMLGTMAGALLTIRRVR